MEIRKKEDSTLSASTAPPGGRVAAGAREIRIVAFPKEFQKDFWKSLDKRILTIFFINFVFVYGFFLFMALQPKKDVLSVDNRLLKKLGKALQVDPKLLEELDKPKEEEKEEDASTAVSTATVKTPQGNKAKADRAAQAKEAAKARQAAAAKAAAGKGVFAVAGALGGKGGGGKFAGANLSGSSTGLDNVLSGLGGIGDATGAEGERTVVGEGGSIKGGAGIAELTSELEGSGGVSVIGGSAETGIIGIGKASVSGGGGGASAADFQGVIDANAAAVNSCYTKELKKSPDLKGKLSVQIKVNPAGRVAGVNVTTNTVGSAVANCVTNKIRGWSFPRGKKGMVTVNQTFVFTR